MLIVLFYSCDKNQYDPSEPNNTNQEKKVILSYTINDDFSETFNEGYEYIFIANDDNTLKNIMFKADSEIKHIESFKYKNGKIIELIKQSTDGLNLEKKQFEYEGDLIVKQIIYLNGELMETAQFMYNNDDFLETIITNRLNNSLENTRTTRIKKLPGEHKISVERMGVATHIISYDEKLSPLATIPTYKPLVKINNNGLTGNLLLTQVCGVDKCTDSVLTNFEYDNDDQTVLSATTTFHRFDEILGTRLIEYTYY
jgi:hypothetical protein